MVGDGYDVQTDIANDAPVLVFAERAVLIVLCSVALYRLFYPLDQLGFRIVEYGDDVHWLVAVGRGEADRELNARQDALKVLGFINFFPKRVVYLEIEAIMICDRGHVHMIVFELPE